jgi:hypothetical protein
VLNAVGDLSQTGIVAKDKFGARRSFRIVVVIVTTTITITFTATRILYMILLARLAAVLIVLMDTLSGQLQLGVVFLVSWNVSSTYSIMC